MSLKNRPGFLWVVVVFSLFLAGDASAADWPTYQHDNARSGVTPERLQPPLSQQWVFRSPHPPARGWSDYKRNADRVHYDDAFHVVAVGDAVYFASSAENKVYSLDAATGKLRWAFYTDAPPRLAPTVWKDKVLVGSDDGNVYCLNGSDGNLLWKFRAAPADDRVVGHGRVMSLWPVRTSVLVQGGVAYFWAGLFRSQGLHFYAVRADDGKLIWGQRSESKGVISPQGYLLASASSLLVPMGRLPPVRYRLEDGRWTGQLRVPWNDAVGLKGYGGTSAMIAGNSIYNIGAQNIVGYDLKTRESQFTWSGARRIVVDKGIAYVVCQGFRPHESEWSGHFGGVETGYSEMLAIATEAVPSAGKEVFSYHVRNYGKYIGGLTKLPSGKLVNVSIEEAKSRFGGRAGEPARQPEAPVAEKDKMRAYLDRVCKWRLALDVADPVSDALMLAGGVIFAGGRHKVIAVDASAGKKLWSGKVAGRARGLAVANGRLFVSTTTGDIHCLAPEAVGAAGQVHPPQEAEPYPRDELGRFYEATAESIIGQSGIKRGFCLILGGGTGRLAYELAKRTNLNIYVLEPHMQKVAAARKALSAAGLYGARVWVEQGPLSSLPYPPYFANLIVCEEAFFGGRISTPAEALLRALRPLGGVAYVGQPPGAEGFGKPLDAALLQDWLEGLDGSNTTISVEDAWAKVTRGALKGAGSWSHQYANPANTVCSEDRLAAPPFGVLWFGDPGPVKMVDRHSTAAAPLSANGRLFIQGETSVMAYDAYNGLKLWEREVPGARRTGTRMEAGNMAATDDSLFIALEGSEKCVRLDAVTGETRNTYTVPPRKDGTACRWGWIAAVGNILYGSRTVSPNVHVGLRGFDAREPWHNRSECVFALDMDTGKVRWLYNGKDIENVGIAMGDEKVFLLDAAVTESQRGHALREGEHAPGAKGGPPMDRKGVPLERSVCLAVALDAATGKTSWIKPLEVTDCIVEIPWKKFRGTGGEINLTYKDKLLLLSAYAPFSSKNAPWREHVNAHLRRSIALSSEDGKLVWTARTAHLSRPVVAGNTIYGEPWAFDLRTGKQKMRTDPSTGKQEKWHVVWTHGCGPMMASASILFFRRGGVGYYDLARNELGGFPSLRPGCGINIISANGLVLVPESSGGCECSYAIKCSFALYSKGATKLAPGGLPED